MTGGHGRSRSSGLQTKPGVEAAGCAVVRHVELDRLLLPPHTHRCFYTEPKYKRNTLVFAPIFQELNSKTQREVLTNTDFDRFVNNI